MAIYIRGDEKIGMFNVANGEQINQFGGYGYLKLAYSPDGQVLVAGKESSVELWDIATSSLLAEIQATAKLEDWAISPDGRYIGTISEDRLIVLWGVVP